MMKCAVLLLVSGLCVGAEDPKAGTGECPTSEERVLMALEQVKSLRREDPSNHFMRHAEKDLKKAIVLVRRREAREKDPK